MSAFIDTRKERTYCTYTKLDITVDLLLHYIYFSRCDDENNTTNPIMFLRDAGDLLRDVLWIMQIELHCPHSSFEASSAERVSHFSLDGILKHSVSGVCQTKHDLPFSQFKDNKEIIGNIDLALVCLERSIVLNTGKYENTVKPSKLTYG